MTFDPGTTFRSHVEIDASTELDLKNTTYKSFVGPVGSYDTMAAHQFSLLTWLGLREHHYLLDIGCGSLRAGKLFIPYLLPRRYFGIEPEQRLIDAAIDHEIGADLIRVKSPSFSNDANFTLTVFERKFDFILAQSIFTHAAKSQIERCFSQAKMVMNPKTIFVATYLAGESDYKGDSWVYPSVVSYRPDYFRALGLQYGLACHELPWSHPNGHIWIAFLSPDANQDLPQLEATVELSRRVRDLENQLLRLRQHPVIRYGVPISRAIRRVRKRILRQD